MEEPTVDSLKARIDELERRLAGADKPAKDWRRVIRLSHDHEFTALVAEEGRNYRESLRHQAEAEADAEDARLEGKQP